MSRYGEQSEPGLQSEVLRRKALEYSTKPMPIWSPRRTLVTSELARTIIGPAGSLHAMQVKRHVYQDISGVHLRK